MREDFWQFWPTHKLFLATNHKPTVKGTDHAIWRRLKLVPFTVSIPAGQQDKQLLEKLQAEWPGILAWAVEGCLVWQKEGLQEPPEVETATSGYRNEQDVLNRFLEEHCVQFPEAWAAANELYEAYTGWAKNSGEKMLRKVEFGQHLQERGFLPEKGAKGKRIWRGVGLLGDHEE